MKERIFNCHITSNGTES